MGKFRVLLGVILVCVLAGSVSTKWARAEPKNGYVCKVRPCPDCKGVTVATIDFCCDQAGTNYHKCILITSGKYACDDEEVTFLRL